MTGPRHWRPMRAADLAAVDAIAAAIHPDYPEDPAVFAERLVLHPAGCHVLESEGGAVEGYAIAHPALFGRPPALNSVLGALPAAPDTYYLHDIALLPAARGGGHAARLVAVLAERAAAAGLPTLSLVAIGGTRVFWEGQGFGAVDPSPELARKLAGYDARALYMARPA